MNDWKKLIVSSSIGNILELYDFILYGCFSSVISKHFFPYSSYSSGLILTFSIFATGCLMRPLGAIVFGILGDKLGKKISLVISIGLISFSTALVGFLPGYEKIGILSPILLTLCRVLQGLSMSGEEIGAALFLMENAPVNRKGLAGSIILGSVYIGLFLSSMVAFITINVFSLENFENFGWRIPFLMSLLLGVFALKIRIQQPESPVFLKLKKNNQLSSHPIKDTFKYYKKDLLAVVLLSSLLGVGVYMFAVYFPANLITFLDKTSNVQLWINAVAFLLTALWTVYVGFLSDYFGAKFFMYLSCLSFIVFAYPIFLLFTEKSLLSVSLSEALLIFCLGLTAGSLMKLLAQGFPQNIKYTAIGLGFNISMTLFGSLTPLVATYLKTFTANSISPCLCFIAASMITLFSLKYMKFSENNCKENTLNKEVLYDS